MSTEKQELAIQIYRANYGTGISMYQVMRQAGYSHSAAKNPKILKESMDWQQAMDHFLPDQELLSRHAELMDSKTLVRADFPMWVPQTRIKEIIEAAGCTVRNSETNPMTGVIAVWYWAPDTKARTAALALAYKLKGKLTDKVEHSGAVDGLFGNDALTITVVENPHDGQHPTGA